MMDTKIQGHWPFGSGEEDFFRFLPYIAMVAILVMWPRPFEQTFVSPSHRSSIWNLTLIGPMVPEEKMLKECGQRRTTTEAYMYLSYKLTIWAEIWAFGSGELIRWIFLFNQVIYSSSPISWPSFKPLQVPQILSEISCWQDFIQIFSKGHNSKEGDNSDKKKKYGSAMVPWGIHTWNFKTLACTVQDTCVACIRFHSDFFKGT